MTDRYCALTVVLEVDVRSDDAEPLINAIQQLRGVLSVRGMVSEPMSYTATQRAKNDLAHKMLKVLE